MMITLLQVGGHFNALFNLYLLLAGLCEIGGGYLIWLWLREGQSSWLGFIGGVILMMYGVIATFPVVSNFRSCLCCLWWRVYCNELNLGIYCR